MTLKKLTLTVGERQLLSRLLERSETADLDAARHIREIRRRCDLREAGRLVNRVGEKLKEYGLGVPTWDDLADGSDLREVLTEKLQAEQEALAENEKPDDQEIARLERLIAQAGALAEEHEYTLDESDLRWLQERCTKVRWDQVKVLDQQGASHLVELPVDPGQLATFADVADQVTAALAAKE